MITRRKLITNTATLAAGAMVPVVAMGKASTIERLLSEAVVNIEFITPYSFSPDRWTIVNTAARYYANVIDQAVFDKLIDSKGGGDP